MAPDPESTFFFYGTLMAPAILARVLFGSSSSANNDKLSTTHRPLAPPRPALLHAYQRSRVRHADYPAILPKKPRPGNAGGGGEDDTAGAAAAAACVRGTVVTGLTQGDVWRLDMFEGDEYERRAVTVKVLGEDGVAAEESWEVQTYVWIAGESRLEAEEWDFDAFVKEKLWRWSEEKSAEEELYADLDKAVKNGDGRQDPTGGRHVNGGSITDALKDDNLQKNGDRTNAWVRSFNG